MDAFVRELIEPFLMEVNQKKIKKIVGIYAGRFQPFGPHHKKTYDWLKKRVDDAYISTSNIKRPPRHPMNFKEKVRHMSRMGVPSNKITAEKNLYGVKNALKKFDSETTAVVYIFGKKDASRLTSGRYFKDFKHALKRNDLVGYEENGYILTAPHVSISVGGKEVSGTTMRELLGSPKIDDSERKKLFKKMFGYFDKGVFAMMTNKFKKLFELKEILNLINSDVIDEFLLDVDIKKLIKESSGSTNFPIDDGPPTFYKSFREYKKQSSSWIDSMYESLGWKILDYIIGKGAEDPEVDYTMKYNVVPTVAYGKVGDGKGYVDPISKYKERLRDVVDMVGWKIVDWMGVKGKKTTGVDVEAPVLAGVGRGHIENTEEAEETGKGIHTESKLFSTEWWLDGLLLEEGFQAVSLSTGHTSTFGTKDTMEKAIKKGTHAEVGSKEAEAAGKGKSKVKTPSFADTFLGRKERKSAKKMSLEERKEEIEFNNKRIEEIQPKVDEHNRISDEYIEKEKKLTEEYDKRDEKLREREDKLNDDYYATDDEKERIKLQGEIDAVGKERSELEVERNKAMDKLVDEWDKALKSTSGLVDESEELKYRNRALIYAPPVKRESSPRKRKGGGTVEDLDEHGRQHKLWNDDNVSDEDRQETADHLDSQYEEHNPLSNMSDEEKAITYDFIASWKSLGAYEARESLGDDYVNERNEHIGNLSHNNVVQMPPPEQLERGMTLKKHKVKKMLEKYKVGMVVNLDFPQGFTATTQISTSFGTPPSEEDVSFKMIILPNSDGQIRGLHIDGITNDPDYKKHADKNDEEEVSTYDSLENFKDEQEIVRSHKSKARVENIKEMNGGPDSMYYEVYLRELEKENWVNESISEVITEGVKFEEDAEPVAPKRVARIVEKERFGGKVYFAEPKEGDRRIKLYKDKKLKRPFKVKFVDVKLFYSSQKYKKRFDRRNKIIGKIRINESIKSDVIKSFVLRNSLNSKLWEDNKLKPEIRKRLLIIAKNFFKDLELEPNVKLKDITLTGSISNYNWSKFSDIDLHLRLDFSQIDDDENFVKNYVLAKKTIWNNKHKITIYNIPVEVYVENLGDIHVASGLYSILKNKWIVVPKKKELQIDLDDIRSKAEGYLGSIPVLQKMMKDGNYDEVIELVEKIQEKLKRMRSSGLERGGEFSVENLAFKALRRSPFIGQIIDMKRDAYDKKMTVSENKQKLFSVDWWSNELITEGGAYGHMAHPFDDNNLTFKDLKNIITMGLGGTLSREDNVSEKLDGQNLMISWKGGKLIAARNKGHIKNAGATALDISGVISKFKGRGDIADAFGFAMKDLGKAIGALSDKQRTKIFMDGKAFMNLEVMWPKSANVINYDKAEIVFHGALEYNDGGSVVGEVKGSGRMLQGMIKQVNQHIQNHYKIGKPNFLTIPKHQDFGKKKKYFLNKLSKLQREYRLRDTDTLSLYHQKFWEDFIKQGEGMYTSGIPKNVEKNLVKRWAFFDKKYTIAKMKKDLDKFPAFLEWVLGVDKDNHAEIVKDNMKPFETLFFELGAEIMKNVSGWLAASPDSTVQRVKKQLDSAISNVRSGRDLKKLNTLKLQLDKLSKIGGLDSIVPSEGVVFKYNGKTYKFTGAFAPINQITGLMTF
jgi:hypothetical protein